MQTEVSGLEVIKQRMRAVWNAGDFGQIARYSEKSAEEFVNSLDLQGGMRVLDVACGTDNLAIPAARRGAEVTGVDLAPPLLEQARQRAEKEGLKATFDEGDAEELPYADGQFDVVMSMFGAMFAPRPEHTAAELARVCRPGGTIAMANWTPNGFVGNVFSIGNRYIAPPQGIPAPVLWGSEETARRRLSPYCPAVRTELRQAVFDFPFQPDQVVSFFREYFGPTKVAFSKLSAAEQEAYARDLEGLWTQENRAKDGRTLIYAEYLQLTGTRG